MSFTFDKNYDNHEQVREWMPRFSELRQSMEARGQYPYNDSFKGQIPGIEGDDEDTAIYLMQGLYRIEAEHRQIEQLCEDGFVQVFALAETTRFADVVIWRKEKYVGGTGDIITLKDARVVPDESGRPIAILPKGKRTNGYRVESAQVLVR